MGEDAIMPVPRKRGGLLKWTCGCLVAFLVTGVIGGIVLWHYMTKWDSRTSPWENLPPETIWAVEAHDLHGIVNAVLDDPGFISLLKPVLPVLLASLESREHGVASGHDLRDGLALYRNIGPLHKALIPNTILLGSIGEGDRWFFIAQPMPWLRWFFGFSREEIMHVDNDETPFYLMQKADWLVVALEEETVRLVMEGWDKRSLPLGRGTERSDAHLYFGFAPPQSKSADTPVPQVGHFTLADPFAGMTAEVDEPVREAPAFRAMALPDAQGWRIMGEAALKGDLSADTLESHLSDVKEPAALRVAGFDLTVSTRLAPEMEKKLRSWLGEQARQRGAGVSEVREKLFWRWLRDGWLADSGSEWSLLAGTPGESGEGYPGLPTLGLGWEVGRETGMSKAASDFSNTLGHWLEAFRASGGHPLLQGVRASVGYGVDDDGLGGEITIPPVLINGAKPAWRFRQTGRGGMGWLVSDPRVLRDLPEAEDLPAADLGAPPAGSVQAAGAWVLSDAFVDGVREWIADRFVMWPGYGDSGESQRKSIHAFGRRLDKAVQAYPRGAANGEYHAEDGRLFFKTRINRGVAVDVK